MKRTFILSLLMLGLVSFSLDVNAEATNADPGDENYSNMQSLYNGGITTSKISGSDWVTIYGKAVCDGNSCSVTYVDGNSSFENVLSKSVVCTNGEKYINYTLGSTGNSPYIETGDKIDGTGYFSEEYYVTCSSDSGSITIDSKVDTTVENDYTGSTTTENPQTGVNTYFIVLGFVAIISYVFMIFVKKFNLFKKI